MAAHEDTPQSPQTLGDAMVEYLDAQSAEVMGESPGGELTPGQERRLRIINEVSNLVFARQDRVGSDEPLREALEGRRQELRADNKQFPGKLADPDFRRGVVSMIGAISGITNPTRETPRAPQAHAQPKPASAERRPYAPVVEQVLQYGRVSDSIGLYGHAAAGVTADGSYGDTTLARAEGLNFEYIVGECNHPTINAWKSRIDTYPEQSAYRDSGNVSDIFAEAIAFTPVGKRIETVKKRAVSSNIWRKGSPAVVEVSYETDYIEGPQGPEPAVQIAYLAQPNGIGRDQAKALEAAGTADYYEHRGGRPGGSSHAYAVVVPWSVAESFKQQLGQERTLARELGDAVVQEVAPPEYKKDWNEQKQAEQQRRDVRYDAYPPTNTLPPEVPLHVYDGMVNSAPAIMEAARHGSNRELYPHSIIS